MRSVVADAALNAARARSLPGPLRRALLAGFAASAQTDAHLATVRALLDGDVSFDGDAGQDDSFDRDVSLDRDVSSMATPRSMETSGRR